MNADDDTDLRQAFRALGDETQANAPAFARLASPEALRAARRRHWRGRATFFAAAVVIPAFFILSTRSDETVDYARFTALTGIDLGEVTWEAPSDFLLEVPGRDMLRTVPLTDRIAIPTPPSDSARSHDTNATRRRSS